MESDGSIIHRSLRWFWRHRSGPHFG